MLALEVAAESKVEALGVQTHLQRPGFWERGLRSLGERDLRRLSGPAKKNKAHFPDPRSHQHYEST